MLSEARPAPPRAAIPDSAAESGRDGVRGATADGVRLVSTPNAPGICSRGAPLCAKTRPALEDVRRSNEPSPSLARGASVDGAAAGVHRRLPRGERAARRPPASTEVPYRRNRCCRKLPRLAEAASVPARSVPGEPAGAL